MIQTLVFGIMCLLLFKKTNVTNVISSQHSLNLYCAQGCDKSFSVIISVSPNSNPIELMAMVIIYK